MAFKPKLHVLEHFRERYKGADDRKDISKVISDFCLVTKYERKYAIKILRNQKQARDQKTRVKKTGPKSKYQSSTLIIHLSKLWRAMNKMCSKKMVKAIPLWIGFYQGCSKQDKELLLSMSASTIENRALDKARLLASLET